MIRDRILSSVLFPAPLWPMMPTDLALLDLERTVLERPDYLRAAASAVPGRPGPPRRCGPPRPLPSVP